MNPQFIIMLFSDWQIIVISIFIMLLLPIVFYTASLDRRPVKIKRSSPIRKKINVKKSAEDKSSEENKTEEENEQEENEKNNSEGGKGA